MPHIVTAADRGGVAVLVARHWHADQHGPFRLELLTGPTADGPAVQARVNHGRWLADCPTPHCRNACYVDPADPRFLCVECVNPLAEGRWLPVEFPDDRDEIEAALLARPVPATRNWTPGETVEQLRAENAEEGI
jgi:hypothetical protein